MKNKINRFSKLIIYLCVVLHFAYVIWEPLLPKKLVDYGLNDQILSTGYVSALKSFFNFKQKISDEYLGSVKIWGEYLAFYNINWALFVYSPANGYYNFKIYTGKFSESTGDYSQNSLLYDSQLYVPYADRPQDIMHSWRTTHSFVRMLLHPREITNRLMYKFSLYFVQKYEIKNSVKVDNFFLVNEKECIESFAFNSAEVCSQKFVRQWAKK